MKYITIKIMMKVIIDERFSGNHPANIAKGNIMVSISKKCIKVNLIIENLRCVKMSEPKLNIIPIKDQITTATIIICISLKLFEYIAPIVEFGETG